MIEILGADICSCLCWADVFSLIYIALLGSYKGCVLPGREFFWDPVRCNHWVFQVKRVSRY